MSTIIRGNASESRLLRWLDKAKATEEDRPVLLAFHVRDGYVLTCNGFQLHLAKAPGCMKELSVDAGTDGACYISDERIMAGEFEVPMVKQEHVYPDVSQVLPNEEPTSRVCIESKHLKDALAGFGGRVALSVYADDVGGFGQIAISSMEGDGRFALVALVYSERITETAFRPKFGEKEIGSDDAMAET